MEIQKPTNLENGHKINTHLILAHSLFDKTYFPLWQALTIHDFTSLFGRISLKYNRNTGILFQQNHGRIQHRGFRYTQQTSPRILLQIKIYDHSWIKTWFGEKET